MSLRSRARNVQRATNLSYQQAAAALRALGREPAELGQKYGWPLGRADLYLVDRSLDPEYREVAERGAPVVIARCAECGLGFFLGAGSLESACPEHRRSTEERALRRACDAVRVRCDALAIVVVLHDGRELAWAGARDRLMRLAVWTATRRADDTLGRVEASRVIEVSGAVPSWLMLAPVADVATVAVHFDGRTSLGVVRLTVRPLLELLAQRLRAAPPSAGGPMGGGGGRGPSGAGANAWEVRPFAEVPRGAREEILEGARHLLRRKA